MDKEKLIIILVIIGIGTLLFKSCHFIPIEKVIEQEKSEQFNAKEYAEKIWNRFMQNLDSLSFDASIVIKALAENKEEAEKKYGKVVGFTYNTLFLVRGKGKVISIDDEKVILKAANKEIFISKELIFGNDIINSTGLVKMSDFDRIYDFNAVSNEINNIVNSRVVPAFVNKVEEGKMVEFVGVLKIARDEEIEFPLQLLPVKLTIK